MSWSSAEQERFPSGDSRHLLIAWALRDNRPYSGSRYGSAMRGEPVSK